VSRDERTWGWFDVSAEYAGEVRWLFGVLRSKDSGPGQSFENKRSLDFARDDEVGVRNDEMGARDHRAGDDGRRSGHWTLDTGPKR